MPDTVSADRGQEPSTADLLRPEHSSQRLLPKLLGLAVILGIAAAAYFWDRSRQHELETQAKTAIAELGGIVVSDANQVHVVSLNLQLINDEAAIKQAMLWVDKLPHLQVLDLSKTAVGDDDLVAVRSLRRLNSLHLNETSVTDAALQYITPLSQLQGLHLAGTAVTDQAFPQIVTLQNLIHLDLSQTAVGSGIAQLAEIENLAWLLLRNMPLAPPMLTALEQLTHLKRLTVGKELGETAAIKSLQEKMPQLSIDW